jgi:hypothetical protein
MLPDLSWQEVVLWLGAAMLVALVLAVLVGIYVFTRIRRIRLPAGADTITALRYTPLSVVILIDLLDFGLDFLAAPFAWVILGKLGLGPLRGVTVVESLIPGTQMLPTMTTAWILVRVFGDRAQGVIEHRPRGQ